MSRVLVAEFKHETNSFCMKPSDLAAYRARCLMEGDEIIPAFAGVKTEMGGFIDACRRLGLKMVPVLAANATPGGKVSKEVFDFALGRVLMTLEKTPVDGLLLALHGAMVCEHTLDGEGDFLKAIRRITGPDLPIVATLDLHANMTDAMVENATAFIGYDTYPHVDTYERAVEAAELLAAVLAGEKKPVMRLGRVPLLCPLLNTAHSPMKEHMEKVHEWEAKPGVISVSLFHGFMHSDIPEARLSLLAVTDGDPILAERIVRERAEAVHKEPERFVKPMTPAKKAVEIGMNAIKGPVVIAETADNPGGGGSGDTTHFLAELLAMRARNVAFAVIVDPETVAQAKAAGMGARIQARLGGKSEEINGKPIHAEAVVRNLTDGSFRNKGPMWHGLLAEWGDTAVLGLAGDGGIDVVVTTRRLQPFDPEIFRYNGIEPTEKQIVVVKSAQHFYAAYGEFASEILYEDGPGLASENPRNFRLKHVARPVYPLDPIPPLK